jgi:AbrB family looped-hinge helix DNA binding protein
MNVAKITSKGQITVPARVRERLMLRAGDKVAFVEMPGEGFRLVTANHPITAIKGIVAKRAKPVTVDEMHAAVASGAAQRSRRGE